MKDFAHSKAIFLTTFLGLACACSGKTPSGDRPLGRGIYSFKRILRREQAASRDPGSVALINFIGEKAELISLGESNHGSDSSGNRQLEAIQQCLVGWKSSDDYRAVRKKVFEEGAKVLTEDAYRRCDELLQSIVLTKPEAKFEFLTARENLRAWQTQVFFWNRDRRKASLARDQAMAGNVTRYLISRKGAAEKTVLWAHNFHLSFDNSQIESKNDEIFGSVLGNLLHQRLGQGYKSIGLIANRVGTRFPNAGPQEFVANDQSLEHELDSWGQDLFIDIAVAGEKFRRKYVMSELFSGDFSGQEVRSECRLDPSQQFSGLLFLRA